MASSPSANSPLWNSLGPSITASCWNNPVLSSLSLPLLPLKADILTNSVMFLDKAWFFEPKKSDFEAGNRRNEMGFAWLSLKGQKGKYLKVGLWRIAGTDIIFVRNQGREPEFGSEHNSGSREDHSGNFIVQDQASNVTCGV